MNERYLLNITQFAAAKARTEAGLIQSNIFNEQKEIRGFSEVLKLANEATEVINNTWLRTEYDNCANQIVQGEAFQDLMDNKDLYPYWMFVEDGDENECSECHSMNGLIFRIGDPEGDSCYPELHYHCGCSADPIDDQEMSEKNYTASKGSDYLDKTNPESGKPYVSEDFRYNPAIQGPMPNDNTYFQTLPTANDADFKMFGMDLE